MKIAGATVAILIVTTVFLVLDPAAKGKTGGGGGGAFGTLVYCTERFPDTEMMVCVVEPYWDTLQYDAYEIDMYTSKGYYKFSMDFSREIPPTVSTTPFGPNPFTGSPTQNLPLSVLMQQQVSDSGRVETRLIDLLVTILRIICIYGMCEVWIAFGPDYTYRFLTEFETRSYSRIASIRFVQWAFALRPGHKKG